LRNKIISVHKDFLKARVFGMHRPVDLLKLLQPKTRPKPSYKAKKKYQRWVLLASKTIRKISFDSLGFTS